MESFDEMLDSFIRLGLAEDVGEKNDLAAANPGLVKRALALMEKSRTADPAWPLPVAWP